MKNELTAYLPIGMLECLVLTIAYRPCYTMDEVSYFEMPDPVTITVGSFFLDKFLESTEVLGMEEYVDYSDPDSDMFYSEELARVLPPVRGWCPYVVNAMHIDLMGKCSVVELDATSPFPSAKRG